MRQKMKFGGGIFSPPQGEFPMLPDHDFGFQPPQGWVLPSFYVPFADAGAGVVNLTEVRTNAAATFTRATTAWTRLSTGLWASVASGSPRSFYRADGVYAGYLSEDVMINIALWSRDQTNAVWSKTSITATQDQTGMDGAANSATRLTATGANGTSLQSVTIGSASRVYSVWMKRITGTGTIKLTVDNTGTGFGADVSSSLIAGQWVQVTSANVTVTNPVFGIQIGTSGDEISVDMSQNEASVIASTPIPTTTVSVTRNRDVLTYPTSPWLDATVGVFNCSFTRILPSHATLRAVFSAHDGTNNNRTYADIPASVITASGDIRDGNVAQAAMASANSTSINAESKVALLYKANDFAFVLNGGTVVTDVSGTVSTGITTLTVGGLVSTGNNMESPVRNLKYFNRRLSNSQLQALTA